MFASMKIGTKILSAFAFAVLVALLIGGVAWWSEHTLSDHLNDLADNKLPSAVALGEMMEGQANVARGVNTLLLRRADAEMKREARAGVDEALKKLDAAIKTYDSIPRDEGSTKAWKEAQGPLSEWRRAIARVLAASEERERLGSAGEKAIAEADDRTWAASQEARKAFVPLDKALDEVMGSNGKSTAAAKEKAHQAGTTGLWTIGVTLLLGAAALLAVGLLLSRSIGGVLRALLAETGKLTAAVEAGKLDTRGDVDTVSAEFQPIVAGVNRTMDAFQKPIQVTQEYVTRISRGDIPPKIADHYQGDFSQIKEALNRCIDAVGLLVADAHALSRAAVEGKLSTRADAGKHQGDFRKVVDGVNQTLDAVLAPIGEARKVLERLAERDLTARVQGSYQGDHAAIKEALNSAAGALHDALAQVAESVEQVSGAAGQIASSSQAVASGASEQASSLEQTHSSLESMSAQTRQAADSAQQANNLAAETKRSAEEGAGAMEQMTSAMGKIRHSAEGTSAIIKDISEIAFQTNLLALNAAVEAARAGEAGRGFAVVAEEVRSLALRAKEAAVKTEELIKESVKQAGEGEAVARLSNEKLTEIVGSAQKVSDIVAEMAASSREQAQGIGQVNKAVGEMDKVTQQNAASSEESSSAAEELSGQSEELAALVGSFKISRAGGQKKAALVAGKAKGIPAGRSASGQNGRNGSNGIHLRPEEIIPLDSDPRFSDF